MTHPPGAVFRTACRREFAVEFRGDAHSGVGFSESLQRGLGLQSINEDSGTSDGRNISVH